MQSRIAAAPEVIGDMRSRDDGHLTVIGTETKLQGGSSGGRWAAVLDALDALDPQGRDALSAEVDEAFPGASAIST